MDKLIDGINIVDGNLQHIAKTKKINGTLRSEIKRVMTEYVEQEVEKLTIPVVSNFVCDAPLSFLPCNVKDNEKCMLPTHCDYQRK